MVLTLRRLSNGRMVLVDEHGQLPPAGTVIGSQPRSPHVGLIGYDSLRHQFTSHNSKARGRCVVTWPEEFCEWGRLPVSVIRYPISAQEGVQIWENSLVDVRRGLLWSGFDNCQDFVSRAVTGRNGSPTRDAVVLGVGVLATVCVAGAALSEQ